jgi:DNA-binding XRE family transcriptional regulator
MKRGEKMKRQELEQAIQNRNLSYTKLADIVGVTRQMISSLVTCQNDPSWTLAQKLARYFGIPAEKLFEISNDEDGDKMPIKPLKKLYDVEEFRSEVLNNRISKSTIYNKIKSGEIKAVHIGRKPFIPAWFIEELLTSRDI